MRKISRQLSKLEGQSGAIPLVDDSVFLLVDLLGKVDAIFWPNRDYKKQSIYAQLQRDYLEGSRGVEARAAGVSEWKTQHAARRALIAKKFAVAIGAKETSSMRLTVAGLDAARSVVGDRLLMLDDVMPMLGAIEKLPGKVFLDRKWVSESDVFGAAELRGDPSEWECLTEILQPLAVAGLLETRCDVSGRVFYRATGAEQPKPSSPGRQNKVDGMEDRYLDSFQAARRSIDASEPVDMSEVVLPIPMT